MSASHKKRLSLLLSSLFPLEYNLFCMIYHLLDYISVLNDFSLSYSIFSLLFQWKSLKTRTQITFPCSFYTLFVSFISVSILKLSLSPDCYSSNFEQTIEINALQKTVYYYAEVVILHPLPLDVMGSWITTKTIKRSDRECLLAHLFLLHVFYAVHNVLIKRKKKLTSHYIPHIQSVNTAVNFRINQLVTLSCLLVLTGPRV